jgi:hypothetical protein
MPQSLALSDLVVPYIVRAQDLGANHAILSVLRVETFETAADALGAVVRGRAGFQGRLTIDPAARRLDFVNDETDPPFDPDRRTPVFDIRETHIDFELFVPRASSAIIAAGVAGIGAPGFAPSQAVLDVWDAPPVDPGLSDFPGSGFTLDLILVAPTLRPPFLQPAKATPEGGLLPDASKQEVAITLPRLRFRLSHGNGPNDRLRFELVSAGVAGLDDPGDIGVAELVSMDPPYAFIGKRGDRSIGIGFRKAVLDLSDGTTPPDIAEKFGFGDDWAGLFLPEVRFYVAPEGARDLAFAAGVRDLLIGFGEHAGISGDFDVALINQGSGAVKLSARFFDEANRAYGIERRGEGRADATLPPLTRMVVDVEGGRAPYTAQLRVDGGAPQAGQVFTINLTGPDPVELRIDVTDSTAGTPITAQLTITARRRSPQAQLPVPRGAAAAAQPVTLSVADGADPRIVLVRQTETDATIAVDPSDSAVRWSVDPGAETPAQPVLTVPVAAGQTRMVQARIPAVSAPGEVDVFFYFDEPDQSRIRPSNEEEDLGSYAATGDNAWTTKARSRLAADGREPGGQPPLVAHDALFRSVVPPLSALTIRGEASFENDTGKRDYNYRLARRRAIAARELLSDAFADRNFAYTVDPEPPNPADYPGLAAWSANWQTHGAPGDRDWWKATVVLPPGLSRPQRQSQGTLNRPAVPPPPVITERDPPPPSRPRAPDWFRSARLKVRIVRDKLVALEMEGEFDFQTATEEKLAATGQLGGNPPPDTRTLQNGAPLGPGNPADGITKFRMLMQGDDATGRVSALLSVGADPADRDGLFAWGWLPGETPDPNKNFGRTLLGSYLSFWPLLASLPSGNSGRVEDVALTGAALALPGVVAALPWFRVERVILYGAEYLQKTRDDQLEAYLLFDIQADWSAAIPSEANPIIRIERDKPLSVRYKAIGLRLSNRQDDGATAAQFSLRPVFDASRGFTIDVAKGGGLKVADPLGRILRVAGARLSRTNPLTFEVDIALGADLGVVAIDRASFRAYLEDPPRFELTALAARVDIPGALIGSGYLEIKPAEIAGQIDLTIRPVGLRVSGALGIAQVEGDAGRKATSVYVGLELLLPVGIPLGSSGLGIFGFRGLFGMHYERNPALGQGSAAPALEWLKASQGKPQLLVAPDGVTRLWTPKLDQWAFGLGIQLGTMEGGFLLNLDGTLILELPGPRLLIVMNARFLQPLPSIDSMGQGGILAVIEITPDHLLIGILASYEIERLIRIVVPVEAFFDFGDVSKWHLYIGRRPDPELGGPPIEVDVLGIVKGTGYLVVKGDGLVPYKGLPAVDGFAIGVGAGASFTWGSTDIGLYLRVGGGFDAVVGFDPFLLGGTFEVSGELRLFIVSIGAHAKLDVLVRESGGSVKTRIKGEVCGEVDFFFFSVEGCVTIEIGSGDDKPDVPKLVHKMALKARSPALALGTATDRPVDGSLGDAREGDSQPGDLPVVPIDSIPVLAMVLPAASDGASFLGTPVGNAPSLPPGGFAPRGSEKYAYKITSIALERVGQAGAPVIGSGTPATWWTTASATEPSNAAQLALLTWEPDPATKALEKNDVRKEQIDRRWGTVCDDAAPPAGVLWTFRFERLGPSATGWRLAGIAWPDPPGSRRSVPPETDLRVTERWRSGDPQLDAARGIIPAMVVAGSVPCRRAEAKPEELAALLRVGGVGPVLPDAVGGPAGLRLAPDDPVLPRLIRADGKRPFRVALRLAEKAAAEPEAATPIGVGALLARLRNGQPIGRVETEALLAAGQPGAAGAEPGQFPCRAKVLASPRFDDGRAVALGDPARREEIERRLKELGLDHGPLGEVVVLHTGAAAGLRVLLFVQRTDIEARRVVLRALDGAGAELGRTVATAADIVPPRALPPRWLDATGPWSEDVADALGFLLFNSLLARRYVPVLLELKGDEAMDRAEIGLLNRPPVTGQETLDAFTPFYVAVIEETSFAEVARQDWDEEEIKRDRETLTSFLGPDSTDNALLHPGSVYKVTVAWNGDRESDGKTGSGSQSFWFRTDSQAPAKLDPWVLTTWPGDREAQVFGGEPVRVVFNTHDVDRLFGAYGRELRLRLSAASAKPPVPPPGLSHPLVIGAAVGTLVPAGALVLSPFESLLEEAVKGRCIPVDESRSRQSTVVVPIPLDPYTDYILDIVSVPVGAPPSEAGLRVFRRHFSTGGHRKLGDFAAGLTGVLVRHQAIAPGTLPGALAPFAGRQPQGAEMDEALRTIGLEALPAPAAPAITVLWEQVGAGTPQPVAVLVDADEPLWRSRRHPEEVADPDGLPGTKRWRLTDTEWLRLEQGAGGDVTLGAAGILRAPGGQRALVVLAAAGQRGRRLRLDLVRRAFPEPFLQLPEERYTILDQRLDRAPWKE